MSPLSEILLSIYRTITNQSIIHSLAEYCVVLVVVVAVVAVVAIIVYPCYQLSSSQHEAKSLSDGHK